jgi:hypothetical protein
MRAVAASMATSACSISKSADAQNERNGIMVFRKVDANDIEESEFFALKRKLHLQKARSEGRGSFTGRFRYFSSVDWRQLCCWRREQRFQ